MHSLVYALQFLPIMVFLRIAWYELIIGFVWLAGSHFIIDSMVLTRHWLRHIYIPPELNLKDVSATNWALLSRNHLRILIVDHVQHIAALWVLVLMVIF